MKINREIVFAILLVVAGIIAVYGPAIYLFLILVAFSEKFYALFPLLVCIGYASIIFVTIKLRKTSLFISLFLGICLLVLAIVGKTKNFTACGESGPGPWEWINFLSPSATLLILVLSTIRYFSWKNKLQNTEPNA